MNSLRGHSPTSRGLALTLAGTLALLLLASPARAFDDSRHGIIAEFGVGPSVSTRMQETYDPSWPRWIGSASEGWSASLHGRFGWGVSQATALWFVADMAVTEDDTRSPGELVANLMLGIGMRFYLGSESPCFFLEGAMGLADLYDPESSSPEDEKSLTPGLEAGIGYEFNRHWSLGFESRRLGYENDGLDHRAYELVLAHALY